MTEAESGRSNADSENYSRASTLVAIKCDNSMQTIKQFSQNVETTLQSERVRGRVRVRDMERERQRVRGRQIAKRLYVLIIIKQNRALHVLIVRQ